MKIKDFASKITERNELQNKIDMLMMILLQHEKRLTALDNGNFEKIDTKNLVGEIEKLRKVLFDLGYK